MTEIEIRSVETRSNLVLPCVLPTKLQLFFDFSV